MATQVRDKAIALYLAASEHSAKNGVIIADTKFEFGIIDGQLALCDEVLTPDSSRFWPADAYEANWDMQGNPPKLPAEVIAKTTEKYQHAYELITGKAFVPAAQLA